MRSVKCNGPTVLQRGGLRAIDCDVCGYAHLWPLPTQDKLDRLYADEYYQKFNANWFAKEAREQWYWRKAYQQRLKTFERLTRFPHYNRIQIYDAGAGAGWFGEAVHQLSHRYFVWGHDPSQAAFVEAAKRGHFVVTVDTLGQHKRPVWHMVHASLLLEHLLDPLDFLRRAHRDLIPGGVICVVAPNEFNLYQRRLGRYGYSPLGPFHVNYFDRASLIRLIERSGFEISRILTTFPMEMFALHGMNYVKFARFGALAHWTRMFLECIALKIASRKWERVRQKWAIGGIGRELEVWARKQS